MKKVMLFDGGKGTWLMGDCRTGELPAELCLRKPEIVARMHEEYLDAGAEVILSNTVGIDSIWMRGEEERALRIVDKGLELVAMAVNKRILKSGIRRRGGVLISAPSATPEKMIDPEYRKELARCYQAQLTSTLLIPPACFVIFETITSLEKFRFLMEVINDPQRLKTRNAFIFSFATRPDGLLFDGEPVPRLNDYIESEIAVKHHIGVNCGLSVSEAEKGLFPGATYFSPSDIYGDASPEKWASEVKDAVDRHHIKMVGGCCNTTPDHIRFLKQILE